MSAWRLGIDLGTNSIGLAAFSLGPAAAPFSVDALKGLSVRIFSDGRNPKDRQSNAVMRRLPRQMRKTRDRGANRNARLLSELRAFGLMPAAPPPGDAAAEAAYRGLMTQDPWGLRARGLDQPLTPHELGRALLHLSGHRGFQSNRKTDPGDGDNGKIQDAANRTREKLAEAGARTLGAWIGGARLACLEANRALPKGDRKPMPQARIRLHGAGAKAYYDFYPTRAMILEEFDALWDAQRPHHPDVLTDAARDAIRETLAFQWPLKAPPVGRCTLDPNEDRAPRALPSVQRLRIYQELNHLTVRLPGEAARPITLEERDILADLLLHQAKPSFDGLRKKLKLPAEAQFNLESEKRTHLDGDRTAARLASKSAWGEGWRQLPLETQDAIVERLREEQDEDALVAWLGEAHGLNAERARAVAKVPLPDGHAHLGRTATVRVLAELERAVVSFDKAVVAAGYESHSLLEDDRTFPDGLPYYGQVLARHVAFGSGKPDDPEEVRYGRIANPTVHVALNQVRRVVNDLIARMGCPPKEIVVELARDLPLSGEGRKELERTQRDNQAANDARRAVLAKHNQPDTYENRLRLRLWEELNPDDPLDRRCVFSGEQIGVDRLFSDEIEIEHILPFSRTLDDGAGNKTLAVREANRRKAGKAPFEAFSHSPDRFDWAEIATRAAGLPKNKRWRFGPDAMQRYEDAERDFLARQLVDTQYLARIAAAYLKRTGADVWVTPGRLTADLRWALGLDTVLPGHNQSEGADPKKNRLDHRHHAVDALVVALTDRALLQHCATLAGRQEAEGRTRLLPGLPPPWPSFRDDVRAGLERLIVSHKPDHGVQGALHNDTAYGLVDPEADPAKPQQVVRRVPLERFKKRAELQAIRDRTLAAALDAASAGVADGPAFSRALVEAGEAMTPPVRRLRILETLRVIPIDNGRPRPFKAYKGDANYCYDIFADAKGRWTGRVISRFEANRPGFSPNSRRSTGGERLILRLRVNDMLELDHEGRRAIMRVVKLSDGTITLAEHQEAGPLKARDADKDDPFGYLYVAPSKLQKRNAVRLVVSPSGAIRHRGTLS
ncbi:MAG: type II CRISPR RNA-guided endonuclease Cas9 [Alphaproteobacteria bacterium]|nr:type II CRISPR RNA-guided endonuclease Cas9 [Alphaproteobacteria bacterium]